MTNITVLVAVYNAEDYLEQCLDSLLGQSLRDIQVVCIDDASIDRSPDILHRYAQADGRVCLMHGDTINEEDIGYRLLRMVLRNPLSRFLVWIFGPLAGKALSEKIRLSLKGKNLKHKKNFPEKYIVRLADRLESDQIPLCLLGHFHQPASIRGIRVLPAWQPDGEIGIYDPATEHFTIHPWKQILNVE